MLLPATTAVAQRLGENLVAAVRRASGDVPGVDRVGVSACVGIAIGAGGRRGRGGRPAVGALGRRRRPAAREGGRARPRAALRRRGGDAAPPPADPRGAAAGWRSRRATCRCTTSRSSSWPTAASPVSRHSPAGSTPSSGAVPPEEFIAVAEESGLVVPLGELVLNEAVRASVAAGLPAAGIRMSCNVSPLQLKVPGFHRVVEGALAAHRMPPSSVVIEVDRGRRGRGGGPAGARPCTVSSSSASRSRSTTSGPGTRRSATSGGLPAQILKIDKSLDREPRRGAAGTRDRRAVTDLGRSIGLAVVVEGVESPRRWPTWCGRWGPTTGRARCSGSPRRSPTCPGCVPRSAASPLTSLAPSAPLPAPRLRLRSTWVPAATGVDRPRR